MPAESRRSRRRAGRARSPGTTASAGTSSRRSRRRPRTWRASRARSRRRGGGRAARGRALPDPPSLVRVQRRGLGLQRGREGLAAGHERRDPGRAIRLGLAGVRVALADVRGHDPLRQISGNRWQHRCERSLPPAVARIPPATRVEPSADGREPHAPGVGERREGPVRSRPAVHQLDRVLVAQAAVVGRPRGVVAEVAAAVLHARRQRAVGEHEHRAERTSPPARRRQRGAATAVARSSAAVDQRRSRAGRGSGAGCRRPSSRPRSRAGRSPSRNSIPGSSVCARPLAGREDVRDGPGRGEK